MKNNYKKKVLVFAITYFPFTGGAEVALREIITRIPDIQFDLITAKFSKDLPSEEHINNLKIYRLGKGTKMDKYLFPLRAFFFSRSLHKVEKYNLVWAMMATWAGIPALFFKLSFHQVKYLLTLQSGDSDFFMWLRTWFWYPIYRLIYTQADCIQVISHWLKERAISHGYRGKIILIPNGVSSNYLDCPLNLPHEDILRKKLNIPQENKIIFSASRLVKKNDLSSLIKAIKILSDYKITLLIAGEGSLKMPLKKLVLKLNLQEQVIFLGHIDHLSLLDYYRLADIFVRPSLSEGQGISFLEAFATHLPVIATPVGGIPDFLIERKTGLYCKVKNPDSIAQQIKLLLDNPVLYTTIQDQAYQLVKQKYNWDNIAHSMEEIILKI